MSNRFKLKNGVLTLVNEKDEVVYESKPTPIKKSFLDKAADFIQNLPEIPTPSFLKLSPEPNSVSAESETEDQPSKKEEANTTEVSTTEVSDVAKTAAIVSEEASLTTEETKVTNINVVQSEQSNPGPDPVSEEQSEQPSPDPVSEEQSEQPEVESKPKRTKVPTVTKVVIEAKVD